MLQWINRHILKTYPLIEDCARCYDCGRNVHDYGVPDELWKEVVGKEIVLCYDCFADRADRKLGVKWRYELKETFSSEEKLSRPNMNILKTPVFSEEAQKEIKETIKQICPAGERECEYYKYFDDDKMHEEVHISNHICLAVRRSLYIHDFEICPFPSKRDSLSHLESEINHLESEIKLMKEKKRKIRNR